MKIFKSLWAIIILFPMYCFSNQYLYPVAVIDQQVYCIFQSSPEIITLLVWDRENNELIPGLLSRYMPAGFTLLPDNSGYSFLDNGIIRVKTIIKRSPQSLEFLVPIYDMQVPSWITQYTGYFAAKVRENYGIFQFDTDANLAGLLLNSKKDFLYPVKIEDSLFYIERIKRGLGYQFRLMNIKYPDTVCMRQDDEMIAFESILDDQSAQEILDFHNEPIAFLRMIDAHTGYLLSYPAEIDQDATHIMCSYYLLTRKNSWHEVRLFDFVIPTSLLFRNSDDRLFESILPLLPRHLGNAIYFADCSSSENFNVNLFVYYPESDTINQLTFANAPGEHYFAPILVDSQLYCGGSGYENELYFIKVIN